MATITSFVKQYPVLNFYILAFVLSWGFFLLIGGRGLFSGTDWQTDPSFVFAVLAMLTGPTIASVLLTGLLSGRTGLRELFAGLLRWRVGARRYAVALLTAPLIAGAVLFALSLTSPVFLPPFLTTGAKAAVLLPAFGVALSTVLEELGWTGFITPRLRERYSLFTTAIIMGVLWGVWHLLSTLWVGRTSYAEVQPSLYVFLYFFFSVVSLTAYRVLMVWIYDRTGSLLVTTLTHASYAACTLPFLSPVLTGTSFLIHSAILSAALWVVAAVVLANHGQIMRQPTYQEVGGATR